MEKSKNNGLIIIIIVLLIMVLGFLGYIIYKNEFKTLDNSSENCEKVETEVEAASVDYITSEKLLKIVNIQDNEEDLFGIQNILVNMSNENISSLDKGTIQNLIFYYATNNNMLTKVSGNDYSKCSSGSGYCNAILQSEADKIAKLYGLSDVSKYFSEDYVYTNSFNNTFYLSFYGGDVSNGKIKHNINLEYNDKDIIMIDNANITSMDSSTTINKKIIYTFKLNSENNYYLANVVNK